MITARAKFFATILVVAVVVGETRARNGSKRCTCDERLIPRRVSCNFNLNSYKLNCEQLCNPGKVSLNFQSKILNMKKQISDALYGKALTRAMSLEDDRILKFGSNRDMDVHRLNLGEITQQWFVKERKMPSITSPMHILDLPNLKTNLCHNVIDWSSKGLLATVFENEIHVCNENFRKISKTETLRAAKNNIKFSKSSDKFACALKGGQIAVCDTNTLKVINRNSCVCRRCTITSIEWTTRDEIIAGCSKGILIFWSSDLKSGIFRFHICETAVICAKLSHDESHLAVSTMKGTILIMMWPQVVDLLVHDYLAPTKAIDWHPYKNWLAVGGGMNVGLLTIFNINTRKELYRENLGAVYNKDALAWNPLSGELAVSGWAQDPETNVTHSVVMVLSSLSKIVDSINYHKGRIPYLLWGRNGTLLATAGADENICIWDFFGKQQHDSIRNMRLATAAFHGNNGNNVHTSNLLRSTIR